jgi:hypothetical protein
MALVCFAFVQPMPEYSPLGHERVDRPAVAVSPVDQLAATPPFVDSVLTGKTFTPYLVVPSLALLPERAGRPLAAVQQLQDLRSLPTEPLIRPG